MFFYVHNISTKMDIHITKGHVQLTLLIKNAENLFFFYFCMCLSEEHVIIQLHHFLQWQTSGKTFSHREITLLISISQATHLYLVILSIFLTRILSFIPFSPVSSGGMPECMEN